MLGIFNNGVSRGCLVDCHWKLVAFERATARGLTRSIPVVTMSSWITPLRSDVKNAKCTETVCSYTAVKGTCKASSYTVGIAQGGVKGYKVVSIDREHVFDVDCGTATCAHRP